MSSCVFSNARCSRKYVVGCNREFKVSSLTQDGMSPEEFKFTFEEEICRSEHISDLTSFNFVRKDIRSQTRLSRQKEEHRIMREKELFA